MIWPATAQAGWWIHDGSDDGEPATERVRFTSQVSFWTGTFDRPSRACEPFGFGIPVPTVPPVFANALRAEQLGPLTSPCPSDNSFEIGVGASVGVTFRVFGPVHLSTGLQLVYTFPNFDYMLKNQVIVLIEFSVLITWPEWNFRPILSAEVTPLLYLSDDARDYALGGTAGFAWRIAGVDWGDLTFTVSHHRADSLIGWQVRAGLSP